MYICAIVIYNIGQYTLILTGCDVIHYLGLTQKAALPLFECFAKQNLPQMWQKSPMSICLKGKCTNIIKKLKKASFKFCYDRF
jgi:hypothetical protein